MLPRAICKICYHVNAVRFRVSDPIWRSVIPALLWDNTICLHCFTRIADEKFVEWDYDIQFWPVSLVSHLNQQPALLEKLQDNKL